MKIIEKLRERAKKDPKKIVFPEGDDERVIEAAKYLQKEGIAYVYLLTPDNLKREKQEEFAEFFYERRKAKRGNLEEARQLMKNPLYYAAMMTKCRDADGFVAGAKLTTSSVVRAAIKCLDIDKTIGLVSSCFIIVIDGCSYGEEGVFVFSDCAVNLSPGSEQLAGIASSSAHFAEEILEFEPRVAFLSFSTKGSAESEGIEKIRQALDMVKSKDSQLLIDGEFQVDSALVPEVAKKKLSESLVAGRANVLIFPSLDAGNISYKLVQWLAKARAIGPIILGTLGTCSDLSRGCSVEDIIDVAAVTVIRAQKSAKVNKI